MNISFNDNAPINSDIFGVNFQMLVDGHPVACSVSFEALQDINPDTRFDPPEQHFSAHRSSFVRMAEQKIRAGASFPVRITSQDLPS